MEISKTPNSLSAAKARHEPSPLSDKDRQRIGELSREFEAIFLELMIRSMRDTVPKDGMLSGGNAENVYQSMLDYEYAKSMADQESGVGLAASIEADLLRAAKTAQGDPSFAETVKKVRERKSHEMYQQVVSHGLQDQEFRGTMVNERL